MNETLYIIIGIQIISTIIIIINIKKVKTKKDYSQTDKIMNLSINNKDAIISELNKSNIENIKSQNTEMDKFKEKIDHFKIDIINTINANKFDTLKITKDEMEVSRKTIDLLKDNVSIKLSEITSHLIDRITNFEIKLQNELNSNIDKINNKVETKLSIGFDKTNKTFNDVIERLQKIDQTQNKIEELSKNVVSLQDVLNDKKARGTFGEVQLENLVAKVFGVNNKIYQRQYKLDNSKICDVALLLPQNNLILAIDSKFPLENYRKMIDKNISENDYKTSLKLFKLDCKKHINDIASKYIIENTTLDYAIMFIPAESVFAEINAYHQDIIDYSHEKRVFITSPTTLMASLFSTQLMIRDFERSKLTKKLNDDLALLGEEFKHFKTRWEGLNKSIIKVTTDVNAINITSEKITNKFEKIKDAKVDLIKEDLND